MISIKKSLFVLIASSLFFLSEAFAMESKVVYSIDFLLVEQEDGYVNYLKNPIALSHIDIESTLGKEETFLIGDETINPVKEVISVEEWGGLPKKMVFSVVSKYTGGILFSRFNVEGAGASIPKSWEMSLKSGEMSYQPVYIQSSKFRMSLQRYKYYAMVMLFQPFIKGNQ